MLIAMEGIDGSGKGTQANLLAARCRAAGLRTTLISFPRYSTTLFGHAIGEFLNGEYGSLGEVHPFLAALLYAGDRFESREHLMQLRANDDVVVCDRYMASNLAHQGAKRSGPARESLLERIRSVEQTIYALPPAELTVWLDLPVPLAQMLIARKARRDYTDKTADLQEADGDYLRQVRDVYASLAAAEPERWVVIPCSQSNEVRSIEAIAEDVWTALRDRGLPVR